MTDAGWTDAKDVKGAPIADDKLLENIRLGSEVSLPMFRKQKGTREGSLVFVAGGPTLRGFLDEIRQRSKNGEYVLTSNFTHDYLIENGIIPSGCIVIDPTEQMADCIKQPQASCDYFVGAVCTPGLARNLKEAVPKVQRILVAYGMEDERDLKLQQEIYKPDQRDFLVGGTMTPLRVMPFAHMLGYTKLEFYGFDSCYTDRQPKTVYSDDPEYGAALARNGGIFYKDEDSPRTYCIDEPADGGFFYAYKKKRGENVILTKTRDGREFLSSPGFTHQAKQFIKWVERMDGKLDVVVHGDSLNSHMLKLHREHFDKLRAEIGDKRWTDEYGAMQRQMHDRGGYGVWGDHDTRLAATGILNLHDVLKRPLTVMDYGAGNGALGAALERAFKCATVTNYDPFHPQWRDNPEPGLHDVVTCCDVMEHVEPQCVENTLKYIADHCRYMAIFTIAIEEAAKTLPDGRNAHVTQRSPAWWQKRISKHFLVVEGRANSEVAEFVCQRLEAHDFAAEEPAFKRAA